MLHQKWNQCFNWSMNGKNCFIYSKPYQIYICKFANLRIARYSCSVNLMSQVIWNCQVCGSSGHGHSLTHNWFHAQLRLQKSKRGREWCFWIPHSIFAIQRLIITRSFSQNSKHFYSFNNWPHLQPWSSIERKIQHHSFDYNDFM